MNPLQPLTSVELSAQLSLIAIYQPENLLTMTDSLEPDK